MFVHRLLVKFLSRLLKVLVTQAGGMTQRWRLHTTPVEVPSLVLKTPSGGLQLSVIPDPEDLTSSLAFLRIYTYVYTPRHRHTRLQINKHIFKNFKK